MDDGAQQSGYEPPAPFAPPSLRNAPLNEVTVLGRTTYPVQPAALPPPAAVWAPGRGWLPNRRVDRAARRRTVAVVTALTLGLAAVIVALGISAAAPHQRTLSLPDAAGPYVRLSTLSASHISSIIGNNGTFGSISNSDLAKAKIAIYSRGAQSAPSALFVGFDAADSPTIGAQLRSEDATRVADTVLAGAGVEANSVAVSAGPLGGALKCSAVRVAGLDATVGVWADSDTLGMLLLFDPTLGPALPQAGAVTRTFREQAEH